MPLSSGSYRSIFNSVDAALLVVEHGRVAAGNAGAGRLLGCDHESLIGRGVSELFLPVQPGGPDPVRAVLEAQATPDPSAAFRRISCWCRPPGGASFLVELTAAWLAAEEGEAAPVLLTVSAILEGVGQGRTTRRRDPATPDLLLGVLDIEGRFLALDPASVEALGFGQQALVGKHYEEWVEPSDREAVAAQLQALAAGAQEARLQLRCVHQDGAPRWVEWRMTSDPEHALIYVAARDIHDQQVAALKLEDTEQLLNAVMSCSTDLILRIGSDYKIERINRTTGHYKPEDVVGVSAFAFVLPEELERTTIAMAKALDSGEITTYETTGYGATNEPAWYRVTMGPLSRRGKIVGLTLMMSDISAPKRLEAELLERTRAELALSEQKQEVRALSTPIIRVWTGVLALPLIGTVDNGRASDIMDKLLGEIVQTGARFAILDLTGVQFVDETTADHLLKIVRAVNLLGSRCVLSGISPSIAQTMVNIGSATQGFVTFGELQDALRYALLQSGLTFTAASRDGRRGQR